MFQAYEYPLPWELKLRSDLRLYLLAPGLHPPRLAERRHRLGSLHVLPLYIGFIIVRNTQIVKPKTRQKRRIFQPPLLPKEGLGGLIRLAYGYTVLTVT